MTALIQLNKQKNFQLKIAFVSKKWGPTIMHSGSSRSWIMLPLFFSHHHAYIYLSHLNLPTLDFFLSLQATFFFLIFIYFL